MTQNRFSPAKAAATALTLVLISPAATLAGPFGAPESVAIPGGGNDNFAQLKQISGFTGALSFNKTGDGAYVPAAGPYNKLISLRFSVDCPAGYKVHQAGIRVRGNDVNNYNVELVSPGDLPHDQSSWEQVLQQEPWDFDAVVSTGIDALEDAGTNGPVYVSLDEVLDSRTEFYAWCITNEVNPSAIFYDSSEDNGHLRPLTRVKYQATGPVEVGSSRLQRLRHRDRAVSAKAVTPQPALRIAPGGCPYDCPPPVTTRRSRR